MATPTPKNFPKSWVTMLIEYSEPDQYGQKHPVETPELIEAKLKELEVEIDKLPDEKTKDLKEAEEKVPALFDNKFRLMFLRAEIFNADLAAKRLAKYWRKRIEVFGRERAFLPLTQTEALDGDEVALSRVYVRVIGSQDSVGRNIVFGDPSHLNNRLYKRDSFVRAVWYMLHAAVEDEQTQQKGTIFVAFPKYFQPKEFDRKQLKMVVDSLKGCIPLRVSALFVCHPHSFFRGIWPVVRAFMPERVKRRVHLYGGSDDAVLASLAKYGLSRDILPSELGGDIAMDIEKWLADRREAGK